MVLLENRTFDELAVGDSATITRTLTRKDITLFAIISGDVNPAHLDDAFAADDIFHHVVAHGMWGGALISAVLGTRLPGPGTVYLEQSLQFRRAVTVGDEVRAAVTVREKIAAHGHVVLDCAVTNQDDAVVIAGEARVLAPTRKVRQQAPTLPQVCLSPG